MSFGSEYLRQSPTVVRLLLLLLFQPGNCQALPWKLVTKGLLLQVDHAATADSGWRSVLEVVHFKENRHVLRQLDGLAVRQTQFLIVVQNRVHVLDPEGVHRAVEQHPVLNGLAIIARVSALLIRRSLFPVGVVYIAVRGHSLQEAVYNEKNLFLKNSLLLLEGGELQTGNIIFFFIKCENLMIFNARVKFILKNVLKFFFSGFKNWFLISLALQLKV